jgi:hypothetical protein
MLCAFPLLVLPIKSQKIAWRKHFYSLTQVGGEMRVITCNEAYRLASYGNLKKWLVARVRQKVGKRRRSHNLTTVLNMV